MKILINSTPNDTHTRIVSRVLKERGHSIHVMNGQDFPEKTSFTISYDSKKHLCYRDIEQNKIDLETIDVIWHRRPILYRIPPIVSKLDMAFAEKENRSLAFSWMACLKNVFWINNPFAKERALSKPLQLSLAKKEKLMIPKTLISNNPFEIKKFIEQNEKVIYKPLTGHVWEESKKKSTFTSIVKIKDLPKDKLLRTTPGIFQTLIPKLFEARVQFFGKSYFAVAIETKNLEYGDIDYRMDPNKGNYSAIELPREIYKACQNIMDELGLVSGGFDFIITPNNKWCFLEVNEAGQFLFLEHWCKDLNILSGFVDFIESKSRKFEFSRIKKEKLDSYF